MISQNTSLDKMADEKVETRIALKLLVDTRKKRVLFAEAGKDFVDFIFSLLTLPVGSIIKLLSPPSMVGCIGKLYQSVDKLNETYVLPSRDKGVYLHPKINASDGVDTLLSICGSMSSTAEVKYYRCGKCGSHMTTVSGTLCPNCYGAMSTGMTLVMPAVTPAAGEVGGFVKGVVTYMVTDDLEVTPMSAISSITLINKFVKKDEVELEEMEVSLGMKEGLALLEASLMSKTALTNVFFGKASESASASASSPASKSSV